MDMTSAAAERAYGLLWKDRHREARALLLEAIGKVGMRRGIQYALDTPPAKDKEPVGVTAIWLKNIGEHVIVEAEIGGKWVEIIRERADGAYSHIVESGGIMSSYLKSLFPAT